ncbi:hypothetical protein QJS04_geneDACA023691 [Acorus gramineus]|uniref:RNA polymerase sigma-70 domain-containing protein n=1 Tax=Acorus gramineus TaxID=55184 RepID=A0AAV9BQ34_ACOGR|nr:hypothetical protein QJS04_geneDACA023691 [Acorus gramineus]
MAIHAFTNTSPMLPPISLHVIPSKPSIQIPQTPLPPSNSISLCPPRPFDEISTVPMMVSLANAALETTSRDSMSRALLLDEIGSHACSSNSSGCDQESELVGNRRQRRRKKRERKVSTVVDGGSKRRWPSKSVNWRYLTPKEEAEFSLYLKAEMRINDLRKKICDAKNCDTLATTHWAKATGMERRNIEEVLVKARECRERIILSYRRLVVSIATPYQGKGLSLQDLVQEGTIGLLRGVERFDSKRGHKLSTYVYWWIKQAIIKAITTKSKLVRLPASLSGAVAKVSEVNSSLSRLGRRPTYEEVADASGLSVSCVRLEILSGPEELEPETMVIRQLIRRDLQRLLKALNEREECIVRLHWGLDGETDPSFEEIGRKLNLSRERVRQIHYVALTKLKESKELIESLGEYIV